MSERRSTSPGSRTLRAGLPRTDHESQYTTDENAKAFAEGNAAAEEAFGKFGELLAKEKQKRNK